MCAVGTLQRHLRMLFIKRTCEGIAPSTARELVIRASALLFEMGKRNTYENPVDVHVKVYNSYSSACVEHKSTTSSLAAHTLARKLEEVMHDHMATPHHVPTGVDPSFVMVVVDITPATTVPPTNVWDELKRKTDPERDDLDRLIENDLVEKIANNPNMNEYVGRKPRVTKRSRTDAALNEVAGRMAGRTVDYTFDVFNGRVVAKRTHPVDPGCCFEDTSSDSE